MDALIIIFGVGVAYVVFVVITIVLARVLFPKIDIDDEDLIGDKLVKLANDVKKIRSKMSSQAPRKVLYH